MPWSARRLTPSRARACPTTSGRTTSKSYAGDRFVKSMRYVRAYPHELPELARRLPDIETPVLIVAGRHDRVVPLANAEFLHERLPTSRLTIVDAGHSSGRRRRRGTRLVTEWITRSASSLRGRANRRARRRPAAGPPTVRLLSRSRTRRTPHHVPAEGGRQTRVFPWRDESHDARS